MRILKEEIGEVDHMQVIGELFFRHGQNGLRSLSLVTMKRCFQVKKMETDS